MLYLLFQGDIATFLMAVFIIILSLTFHEYGHAVVATWFGDHTPQYQGRLTLNPVAHIDVMGLLMVILIGFGYAKPVQTDFHNYTSPKADLWIAAAGPCMNLILAVFAVNFYGLAVLMEWSFLASEGATRFFLFMATINLILMIFNLIPLGSLDGHYILPHFLPKNLAHKYTIYNAQYGNMLLLGFILLSIVGIPIFQFVWSMGQSILPLITFIY